MSSPKAKILIFSSSYVPVLGGVQTVTHNLARQMVARGHEVRVVTNRYPVQLPATETIDEVNVDRLLFLRPRVDQLRRRRFDLFAGSLYFGPSSHRQLKRIVREFRPDVVNVHFPEHEIDSLVQLRRRLNFRLVVSLHGYDVQQFINGNGSRNGTERPRVERMVALLESADAVTAVSQDLMLKASRLQPQIVGKTHVIPNGIDLHRFTNSAAYEHERPYILALGRLVYSKGFDLLIDAFAKGGFQKRYDLIIAGTGEELPALQRQVDGLGLSESVYFFGQASAEEVASLLKSSLGVVVPSRDEQFGIVALESLAAGKPLVATKTGGMQQWLTALINDNNGEGPLNNKGITLVEPAVEGIASGLSTLLGGATSPTGFRIPEKYTWPKIAERYEDVLLPREKGRVAV